MLANQLVGNFNVTFVLLFPLSPFPVLSCPSASWGLCESGFGWGHRRAGFLWGALLPSSLQGSPRRCPSAVGGAGGFREFSESFCRSHICLHLATVSRERLPVFQRYTPQGHLSLAKSNLEPCGKGGPRKHRVLMFPTCRRDGHGAKPSTGST